METYEDLPAFVTAKEDLLDVDNKSQTLSTMRQRQASLLLALYEEQ